MLLMILSAIICVWLLYVVIKIAVKVAWCFAKILACILCVIALPLLIVLMLTAGGVILFLPVILLVIAFAAIESC